MKPGRHVIPIGTSSLKSTRQAVMDIVTSKRSRLPVPVNPPRLPAPVNRASLPVPVKRPGQQLVPTSQSSAQANAAAAEIESLRRQLQIANSVIAKLQQRLGKPREPNPTVVKEARKILKYLKGFSNNGWKYAFTLLNARITSPDIVHDALSYLEEKGEIEKRLGQAYRPGYLPRLQYRLLIKKLTHHR